MFRFLNARLISSLETQVSVLKAETSRLHSTSAGLRIDLNKTRGEVSQRDDYIGSLRNDRMSAMQRISSLQRELTDSRNVAFKLRQQVAEQVEEIEELEEELDAAEAANDCLLERNLQLSNAVTQLSFEAMFQPPRVTATEVHLRERLKDAEEAARLANQNKEIIRKLATHKIDMLDKARKDNDALKAEVESLKQQRTAVVKERDGLKKERDELKIELTLTSLYLGDIVKGFNGIGSSFPVKAMHEGKAFYYRLIAYRPSLVPSRGQPHAKAA